MNQELRSTFQHQLSAGLHPAAALAVYARGKLVLDLADGELVPGTDAKVQQDTLFRAFSSGKPLAAACLWVLYERGRLGWDDPVSKHWPEFGLHGKDRVTVRQVLSHTAGLPTTPQVLAEPGAYADWGRCVAAMENAELVYEPGALVRYHGVTYGWLVGELVGRISGLPFNEFFVREVARPLGLHDCHFVLPSRKDMTRVARLQAMEGFADVATPASLNQAASYFVVQPAFSLMTTARDLARFYAALAGGGAINGVRWLKPETVTEVTSRHSSGVDVESGRYLEFGLGLSIPAEWPNNWGSREGARSYGHTGLASSMAWADEEDGVAVAYLTAGLQPSEVNRIRLQEITAAVRASI